MIIMMMMTMIMKMMMMMTMAMIIMKLTMIVMTMTMIMMINHLLPERPPHHCSLFFTLLCRLLLDV